MLYVSTGQETHAQLEEKDFFNTSNPLLSQNTPTIINEILLTCLGPSSSTETSAVTSPSHRQETLDKLCRLICTSLEADEINLFKRI